MSAPRRKERDEIVETTGDRIRILRKAQGMNQAEFAKEIAEIVKQIDDEIFKEAINIILTQMKKI